MRTTLEIDHDVLEAVKGVARRDRITMGQVVTSVLREKLLKPARPSKYRSGIKLLPVDPKSGVVTNDLIDRLREEFE